MLHDDRWYLAQENEIEVCQSNTTMVLTIARGTFSSLARMILADGAVNQDTLSRCGMG